MVFPSELMPIISGWLPVGNEVHFKKTGGDDLQLIEITTANNYAPRIPAGIEHSRHTYNS